MQTNDLNDRPQDADRREVLDGETLAAMEEGIRSEQTGRFYSWEEAKKFARERRKLWTELPDRRTA